MTRKIKIQTVDRTNLTNLENALHENRDKKHVTISGPEKTIIVSDDTSYRSDEELKAELEQDKQVKKEIRKELEQTKKIIEKLRNENICTKTNEKELNAPDIPDIIEKTRKIINKFREEDNNPCNDNTGDAIASTNITSETLCQNLLKKYPNLKEKTFALIKDNNPLEENEQNRVSVTTDNDKNFIQNSKKYVEEHIIPRKKELGRLEEATRNIQNLSIPVTKPYEEVNHPDHYNVYDVEVVEMMERIFGIEETMSWCKLNAFKYRMRAGEKPTSTVEKDLKKEKWCLNKYKELKSKK